MGLGRAAGSGGDRTGKRSGDRTWDRSLDRSSGRTGARADPRPELLRRRNLIPLLVLGFLLVLVSGWRSFEYSRQLLNESQEQSYREVLRVLPRSLLPHLVVDDYVAIEQDLEGVMVDPSIAALLVVDPRGRVLAHLERERPGSRPLLRYGPSRLEPLSPEPIAPQPGPGPKAFGEPAEVRWQRLEAGGSTLGWLRLSHWSTNSLAVVRILARQYLQLMALTLAVFVALLTASVLVVRREGFKREAQLQEQGLELLENSLHDPLTGLANRRGLQVLLEQAIDRFNAERSHHPSPEPNWAKRGRADEPMAGNPVPGVTPERDVLRGELGADLLVICLIDLDEFKPVNDRYGHAVGDQLLVEVGRRLCQCLRTLPVNLGPEQRPPQGSDQAGDARAGQLALADERSNDQVARLGGDEFVCILAGCSSPDQVEGLAQRILHSLGQPFALERHSLTVGASLGIAWSAGSQAPSPLTLLQVADHAMYGAKARGKNHYQLEEIPNPGDLSSATLRPPQADKPGFP